MLDFTLSEEQEKIRLAAREFALREIVPAAAYYDELNRVPEGLLRKAFDAGLMNGDIPAAYGGKGQGLLEGALVTEEIAAACSGIATSLFVNSLGLEPIVLSDKEHIKKKYLGILAREPKFICFATSEPTMGSDVAGMRCMAEKKGNDYILNGTKYWITNGGIADYMTVFATIDPASRHEGICAFVVEREWEGVRSGLHIPKMGQRGSNTAALNFKNVRVPAENVLAEPGSGFVLAMKTFSRTRPIIGAFAVGAARSAMEFAVDYVKKRQAFGTKLKNFEAIQFKIAEMYQKIETSRLLVWKSAWESDNGNRPHHQRLHRQDLRNGVGPGGRERRTPDRRGLRLYPSFPLRKNHAGHTASDDIRGDERGPEGDTRRPCTEQLQAGHAAPRGPSHAPRRKRQS